MRWSSWTDASGPERGRERVGVWDGDRLHPVPRDIDLVELLADGRLSAAADAARREPAVNPGTVTLRVPVPRPPAIRDFMAFEEHVVTASAAIGLGVDPLWYRQPVFYFTNPASLLGADDDVAVPPGCSALDYELEVAAVIGREGRDLTAAQALDHVAGYVLFCDWSARDLQGEEMRLNLGPAKGKDFASSCGPWMVTPDELPAAATMTAAVNGTPYSSGRLDALYWSFGEMIAYASRGTRVVPGDLIGSGTVGTGCILELSRVHGSEAYPWLAAGDTVHLEADGLGAIDARVVPGPDPVPLRPEETLPEAVGAGSVGGRWRDGDASAPGRRRVPRSACGGGPDSAARVG